ncbi:MAG: thioesterase family protein [Desulfarculaceae bacterium]|nr:thioesterase family protein [Desulfarculaceae bacterium]
MYPWIRASKVGALAMAAPRMNLGGTSRIRMMVWPGDLDALMHLNNGRYLTLMDLGRLDLAMRAGLVPVLRRNSWTPLLGATTTRFWKPLKLFTRFELTTRIVWWDEKWIYLQHEMHQGGHQAAQALAKLVVKGKGGTVPPAELAREMGLSVEPPEPPSGLVHWGSWEEALKQANNCNGNGVG